MSCAFCGGVEAFTNSDQLQEEVPQAPLEQVDTMNQQTEFVPETIQTTDYSCQTLPVQQCLYTAQGEIRCSQ